METEKQNNMDDGLNVEKTLAIIKPDAISKANEIIEEIKNNGFSILQVKWKPTLFIAVKNPNCTFFF